MRSENLTLNWFVTDCTCDLPAVRLVLKFGSGVQVASSLDSNQIQDERSLNTTLYNPKLAEVFGKDIMFDLQGILVERLGANLRNRMAHGLMDHQSFYSIEVPYL